MEENIFLGARWVPIEKITLLQSHEDSAGAITHCLVSFAGEEHMIYGQVARAFTAYCKRHKPKGAT
jgi:hypothetical protein